MAHSTTLIDTIESKTRRWGSSAGIAHGFGISPERLSQIKGGSSVGTKAAARILAKIREEDLALADKIEDELLASWRDELRRRDQ